MLQKLHVAVFFIGALFAVGTGDEASTGLCRLPNGNFPNPDDCASFIRCQSDQPEVEQCPDGLLYNPFKSTCDFSQTGDCSNSDDFDSTSTPVSMGDIECPQDGPNIYAIQSSCSEYYLCNDSVALKVECPAGLLLNKDKLTCDYKDNVECDDTSSTEESTVGITAIYESSSQESEIETSTNSVITPEGSTDNALSSDPVKEISFETQENTISEKYMTETADVTLSTSATVFKTSESHLTEDATLHESTKQEETSTAVSVTEYTVNKQPTVVIVSTEQTKEVANDITETPSKPTTVQEALLTQSTFTTTVGYITTINDQATSSDTTNPYPDLTNPETVFTQTDSNGRSEDESVSELPVSTTETSRLPSVSETNTPESILQKSTSDSSQSVFTDLETSTSAEVNSKSPYSDLTEGTRSPTEEKSTSVYTIGLSTTSEDVSVTHTDIDAKASSESTDKTEISNILTSKTSSLSPEYSTDITVATSGKVTSQENVTVETKSSSDIATTDIISNSPGFATTDNLLQESSTTDDELIVTVTVTDVRDFKFSSTPLLTDTTAKEITTEETPASDQSTPAEETEIMLTNEHDLMSSSEVPLTDATATDELHENETSVQVSTTIKTKIAEDEFTPVSQIETVTEFTTRSTLDASKDITQTILLTEATETEVSNSPDTHSSTIKYTENISNDEIKTTKLKSTPESSFSMSETNSFSITDWPTSDTTYTEISKVEMDNSTVSSSISTTGTGSTYESSELPDNRDDTQNTGTGFVTTDRQTDGKIIPENTISTTQQTLISSNPSTDNETKEFTTPTYSTTTVEPTLTNPSSLKDLTSISINDSTETDGTQVSQITLSTINAENKTEEVQTSISKGSGTEIASATPTEFITEASTSKYQDKTMPDTVTESPISTTEPDISSETATNTNDFPSQTDLTSVSSISTFEPSSDLPSTMSEDMAESDASSKSTTVRMTTADKLKISTDVEFASTKEVPTTLIEQTLPVFETTTEEDEKVTQTLPSSEITKSDLIADNTVSTKKDVLKSTTNILSSQKDTSDEPMSSKNFSLITESSTAESIISTNKFLTETSDLDDDLSISTEDDRLSSTFTQSRNVEQTTSQSTFTLDTLETDEEKNLDTTPLKDSTEKSTENTSRLVSTEATSSIETSTTGTDVTTQTLPPEYPHNDSSENYGSTADRSRDITITVNINQENSTTSADPFTEYTATKFDFTSSSTKDLETATEQNLKSSFSTESEFSEVTLTTNIPTGMTDSRTSKDSSSAVYETSKGTELLTETSTSASNTFTPVVSSTNADLFESTSETTMPSKFTADFETTDSQKMTFQMTTESKTTSFGGITDLTSNTTDLDTYENTKSSTVFKDITNDEESNRTSGPITATFSSTYPSTNFENTEKTDTDIPSKQSTNTDTSLRVTVSSTARFGTSENTPESSTSRTDISDEIISTSSPTHSSSVTDAIENETSNPVNKPTTGSEFISTTKDRSDISDETTSTSSPTESSSVTETTTLTSFTSTTSRTDMTDESANTFSPIHSSSITDTNGNEISDPVNELTTESSFMSTVTEKTDMSDETTSTSSLVDLSSITNTFESKSSDPVNKITTESSFTSATSRTDKSDETTSTSSPTHSSSVTNAIENETSDPLNEITTGSSFISTTSEKIDMSDETISTFSPIDLSSITDSFESKSSDPVSETTTGISFTNTTSETDITDETLSTSSPIDSSTVTDTIENKTSDPLNETTTGISFTSTKADNTDFSDKTTSTSTPTDSSSLTDAIENKTSEPLNETTTESSFTSATTSGTDISDKTTTSSPTDSSNVTEVFKNKTSYLFNETTTVTSFTSTTTRTDVTDESANTFSPTNSSSVTEAFQTETRVQLNETTTGSSITSITVGTSRSDGTTSTSFPTDSSDTDVIENKTSDSLDETTTGNLFTGTITRTDILDETTSTNPTDSSSVTGAIENETTTGTTFTSAKTDNTDFSDKTTSTSTPTDSSSVTDAIENKTSEPFDETTAESSFTSATTGRTDISDEATTSSPTDSSSVTEVFKNKTSYLFNETTTVSSFTSTTSRTDVTDESANSFSPTDSSSVTEAFQTETRVQLNDTTTGSSITISTSMSDETTSTSFSADSSVTDAIEYKTTDSLDETTTGSLFTSTITRTDILDETISTSPTDSSSVTGAIENKTGETLDETTTGTSFTSTKTDNTDFSDKTTSTSSPTDSSSVTDAFESKSSDPVNDSTTGSSFASTVTDRTDMSDETSNTFSPTDSSIGNTFESTLESLSSKPTLDISISSQETTYQTDKGSKTKSSTTDLYSTSDSTIITTIFEKTSTKPGFSGETSPSINIFTSTVSTTDSDLFETTSKTNILPKSTGRFETTRTSNENTQDFTDYISTTTFERDLTTEGDTESSSKLVITSENQTMSTPSLAETTTLNAICVTSNGFYPNPDDCSTFYQCSKGVPKLSSCTENDHFNPVLKRCTDPCTAKCDPSTDCPTTGSEGSSEGTTLRSSSTFTDDIFSSTPKSDSTKTESSSLYTVVTNDIHTDTITSVDIISNPDSTSNITSPETDSTSKTTSAETDSSPFHYFSTTNSNSESELTYSTSVISTDHPSGPTSDATTTLSSVLGDLTSTEVSTVSIVDLHTTESSSVSATPSSVSSAPAENGTSSSFASSDYTPATYASEATTSEIKSTMMTRIVTNSDLPTKATLEPSSFRTERTSSEDVLTEDQISTTDAHTSTNLISTYKSTEDTSSYSSLTSPVTEAKCENGDCLSTKVPTLPTPPPYKLCHRNDFLPRPNCNEYMNCTGQIPRKMQCPLGLHFNPTSRVCDWPNKAECGGIAMPLFRPDDSFQCPCKSCLIPSTESCSHYFLCLGYTAFHMKCSNGLLFDISLNTCNYAVTVECLISTTTKKSTVLTTKSTISTTKRPTTVSTKRPTVLTTKSTVSTTKKPTTPSTTRKPSHFTCPRREGLFKYPGNCGKFYQCSNGHPYEMHCPPTTHFSELTERCEYPCDAKCDLTLPCGKPSTAAPSDPRCTCRNCKLPSSLTCAKYIVCVNGRARVENCPWGQTFDVRKQTCDWANKVKCHHSQMCPELNGEFPHKDDCHKFVHCSNGIPYEKKCPSILEFDPIKKRCEWPAGRCNNSPIPKEFDIFKEQEHRVGWRCPKTYGYFSDDHHCNRFYHCSHGTPSLKECPEGLLYNPRHQTCDWKKHVQCNSDRHHRPKRCRFYDHQVRCEKDRKPKPHAHCNMYYDCTAGRACARQCPVGLYFNRTTGICDLPANVMCPHAHHEDYSLKEFSSTCSSRHNSHKSDPADETCFYRCRQGKVISGCCSRGRVYNEHTDECERRTNSFRI